MRTLLLTTTTLLLAGTPSAQTPGSAIDPSRVETRHLVLTTSSSHPSAAPGARLSLFVDVAPKPKMHVYAPEQKELIPISLSLRQNDGFKAHAPKFPKSEKYFFEPLGETQFVYSKSFRIVQDVTIALTPAMRARARETGAALIISGTLRYQACDDEVCYLPRDLPVSWTIRLEPSER